MSDGPKVNKRQVFYHGNLLSLCLGVGLAACSGFRVFVPLLLSSLALHFGFVSGAAGFEWMGTWTAIAILSTATVLEIGGYYIPWVDNLLDTIATPAAFAAGTLLTTSFVEIDNPVLQWGLGLIMGGGTVRLYTGRNKHCSTGIYEA